MKCIHFVYSLALLLLTGTALAAEPVSLRIIAINDLHSQLLPPDDTLKVPDADQPAGSRTIRAGGIAQMATLIHRMQAGNPNNILVGAGDLVGNSPFEARLLHEESTLRILDSLGLALSSVGNNEFYYGWRELLRWQQGGCAREGCLPGEPYGGIHFQYLAASTLAAETGKPILPAYAIRTFQGIPVAFIGLTRRGSPDLAKPYNYEGIRFADEVETVNALVPEIRAKGVEAIVLLLHEGATSNGAPNDCQGAVSTLATKVEKIDPAVDVIITAHTHQAYNCHFGGRPVTQASSHGRMLTTIDLMLDPASRDVISATAENHIVDTADLPPDPAVQQLVEHYEALAHTRTDRVLATTSGPITAQADAAGESALGQLVADSMLTAVPEAQIAFISPNSLRAPQIAPSAGDRISYANVFPVLLRGRELATLQMTGAQIRQVLDLQWKGRSKPLILPVSKGFSYVWRKLPAGESVLDAESVRLNGKPLRDEAYYRLVVDASLAEGEDGMKVFREGREKRYLDGTVDYELLARYIGQLGKLDPATEHRIELRE